MFNNIKHFFIGFIALVIGLSPFGGHPKTVPSPSPLAAPIVIASPAPTDNPTPFPTIKADSKYTKTLKPPVSEQLPSDMNGDSNDLLPTPHPYVYQAQTPEPAYQPKNKTCTQSGDYTYCSDGTSFLTSGNSTYINGNGKSGSCTTSGGYTSCSDGSTAIQNGNYGSYSGNDKSGTCIKNGPWTNCSDGSSTYNP